MNLLKNIEMFPLYKLLTIIVQHSTLADWKSLAKGNTNGRNRGLQLRLSPLLHQTRLSRRLLPRI